MPLKFWSLDFCNSILIMKGISYIENCAVSSEDLVHDSPKEASIDIQNASLVHLLVKVDDPNHCCKNLVRKKKKKKGNN